MEQPKTTDPVRITLAQATAAFTLWEQMTRDNPADFLTPEECRAMEFAEFGERSAIYFFALLRVLPDAVNEPI